MAAITENSVISSLAEVRRLTDERNRYERQQAKVAAAERRAWEERRRKAHRQTSDTTGRRQMPVERARRPQRAAVPVAVTPTETVAARKPRSAAGPVFLTMLLFGAAGAAGYFKLQEDFDSKLAERDAVIAQLQNEQARIAETRATKVEKAAPKPVATPTPAAADEAAYGPEPAAAAQPTAKATKAATVAKAKPRADKKKVARHKARPAKRTVARASRDDKTESAMPSIVSKPARGGDDADEPVKAAPAPRIVKPERKQVSDDPLAGLRF